jgi:23S rRNA A2030 N6-methylase RlmJ
LHKRQVTRPGHGGGVNLERGQRLDDALAAPLVASLNGATTFVEAGRLSDSTLAALREALERFADAVVVIWLPQLQLLEAAQLPQRLKATADSAGKKGWLHAQLTVAQADERGFGMLGSSVFVANPPHTLFTALQPVLPFLVQTLGQFDGARSALDRSAKS